MLGPDEEPPPPLLPPLPCFPNHWKIPRHMRRSSLNTARLQTTTLCAIGTYFVTHLRI